MIHFFKFVKGVVLGSILGYLAAKVIGMLIDLPPRGTIIFFMMPLICALLGGFILLFLGLKHLIFRLIGGILLIYGIYFIGSTVYYNGIRPNLEIRYLKNTLSQKPISIAYEPVTWSGKNIGVKVMATFKNDPRIHVLDFGFSQSEERPEIVFDDGMLDTDNLSSIQLDSERLAVTLVDGVYQLEGVTLFPSIGKKKDSKEESYCLMKSAPDIHRSFENSNFEGKLLTTGKAKIYMKYPVLYNAGKGITDDERVVAGSLYEIDVDDSIYRELPCILLRGES